MNYTASKTIWDESNPLPCIEIRISGEMCEGIIHVDWEQWVQFCKDCYHDIRLDRLTLSWLRIYKDEYGINHVDYEDTMTLAPNHVLKEFINDYLK